ncbi:uncharacterized protein [Venturia canescens]|nr:uncharacterized protein LOC122415069 isoform X2 [Venturia canescens]
MGVGGFIVVAACVMTFEARDSAAKVVPARFRFNQGSTLKNRNQRSRRSTSSQTTKWDHQFGLFRVNRTPSPSAQEIYRKQLTAEFLRFSKNLQDKGLPTNPIKKSPSAPSLVTKKSPGSRKAPKYAGCALLNPELLQRQALSVDNPGYSPPQHRSNGDSSEQNKINGSQVSMAMDLHIPNKGPVTLKVKDRSDTARRHQLLRQTKIEDVEEAPAPEDPKKSHSKKPQQDAANYSWSAYSRYPDDFLPRKRSSIDVRTSEELGLLPTPGGSCSPRDFRKISSPNFRNMSFDRIGGERRMEKSLGSRKASLEFKRSPDFRRADYRCMLDDGDMRSRANTGESVRRQRQPKLYHSRSDDTRRRSFDKHRRDSQQASRHSLNTQVVLEGCGPEYELKYFATPSNETNLQDNRANSDESHHVVEINLDACSNTITPEQISVESDALLEEPELENLTDPEDDSSDEDDDDDDVGQEIDEGSSKLQTQSSKGSCKKRLVTQQTVLHVDLE